MSMRLGSGLLRPRGIAAAYVGSDAVFLGLPAGYRRLQGIKFNAATYYLITGFRLRGSDTLRLSVSITKACNVLGCYTTAQAQDNYSLYASTSSNGKYLRYNGSTYNSYFPSSALNRQHDIIITPTGSSGMPTSETWTEKSFTAPVDLCIGTTSVEATSSKLAGNIYGDIIVDGRLRLIPCERQTDHVIGYWDARSGHFYEPIGSAPASLGYDD